MKKKLTTTLLAMILIVISAFSFTACKNNKKTDQDKITILTLTEVGTDYITLQQISNAEYKLTTWQDSNTFINLTADTEYTFYVRYKETDTKNASPISEGFKFKTLAEEQEEQNIMLTPEQQVQIAKDTFTSIYNATINPVEQSPIRTMSFTEQERQGLFDDLFEKYADCIEEAEDTWLEAVNSMSFILSQSQIIFELLNKVGTASINYEYEVQYNFISDTVSYLPNKFSFHGVKQEDGYNKVYYSYSMPDIEGRRFTYSVYYNSDTDYGFEDLIEDDGQFLGYLCYTKTPYTSWGVDTKLCDMDKFLFLDDMTEEEKNAVMAIVDSKSESMKSIILNLEKENNDGNLKTLYSGNKLTLDYDTNKSGY